MNGSSSHHRDWPSDTTHHAPQIVVNVANHSDGFSMNGHASFNVKPQIRIGRGDGRMLLYAKSVKDAAHDAYRIDPTSTCLPGTRSTALRAIWSWAHAPHDDGNPTLDLFWLRGTAGAGKTAISQTVCEGFKAEGRLGADFFFWRSGGRIDPRYLFVTLAAQLAAWSSELGDAIEAVVENDPAVVDSSMERQFQKLIVDPMLFTMPEGSQPLVILIDGLDECYGEDYQIRIIRIIQDTLRVRHHECFTSKDGNRGILHRDCSSARCDGRRIPVHFIVASRPEIWIQRTFSYPTLHPRHAAFDLAQDKEVHHNICMYFVTKFHEIRNHPDHSSKGLPPTWPPAKAINTLVDNASGHFIYASVVVKFVEEPTGRPDRRLQTVLDSTTDGQLHPLAPLDALYRCVLNTILLNMIRQTLNVIAALSAMLLLARFEDHYNYLEILDGFLGLQRGDSVSALRNLHSVIFVPENPSNLDKPTDSGGKAAWIESNRVVVKPFFHHKSFADFIHDRTRSGPFFMDVCEGHQLLTIGCLRVLQHGTTSPALCTPDHLTHWAYAFRFWSIHCTSTGSRSNATLLKLLQGFQLMARYFVLWRQAPQGCYNGKHIDFLVCLEWLQNSSRSELPNFDHYVTLYRAWSTEFSAIELWLWLKAQSDISATSFPILRLKLWTLKKAGIYSG